MSREELTQNARRQRKPAKKKARWLETGILDVPFLTLVILLVGIGLLMMFSASYVRSSYESGDPLELFGKQALFAAMGIAAMYAASFVPVHTWRVLTPLIYGVTIVLLLAVLFVGVSANGAKRWVQIAGQQFQPSEVAKFAVICMISTQVYMYREKMSQPFYGVLMVGLPIGLVLGLIALEKHLSVLMIIALLALIMMFVGGSDKRWLAAGIVLAILFLVGYIMLMGYANNRFTAWLNPEADAQDTGYQILQSQYAIGSGGLFGLGFGLGRQKYLYLPEEHNDYIFSIVCEELGLVGAVGIIILFILLIVRGYRIALNAGDRFDTMLGVGITTLLCVQVLLNIAVVSNLLPSTGVGLPFFSYGGTNLLMNLGEMGIMLSISRSSPGGGA